MARFRLIFLLAFLVAGCELLFGIKQSTSSGAGGGTTGGGAGGRVSGSTGGGPGGGASGTSSSGAPGFCASQDAGYYFCADFDEGSILGADASTLGWDGIDQTAGGPIDSGLDDAVYVSKPASLEVIAPAMPTSMPTSVCQSSRVKKDLKTPGTVHLDFDFYPCDVTTLQDPAAFAFASIDCEPASGESTFGVVKLGASQGAYALDVFGVDGSADVGTPSGSIPIPSLADAGWTHVHIVVTFGDDGPVTLVVGDPPQTSTLTVNTSCPGGHDKALSMGILACGAPAPACTARFDNVLVYTDP